MRLPYFPLHAVTFPHLPLPLDIFEPRYRAMVVDLLEPGSPFDGRFVVSMITNGPEVGGEATTHAVGTICEVRSAEQLADGRWTLISVGIERARLDAIERTGPYATVEASALEDHAGSAADDLVPRVQSALDAYLAGVKRFVLQAASGGAMTDIDHVLKPIRLPDDPVAASYAVGGILQVELSRKQRLLELPDAATRLRAELALLRAETKLLGDGELPTVPSADLGYHPN